MHNEDCCDFFLVNHEAMRVMAIIIIIIFFLLTFQLTIFLFFLFFQIRFEKIS